LKKGTGLKKREKAPERPERLSAGHKLGSGREKKVSLHGSGCKRDGEPWGQGGRKTRRPGFNDKISGVGGVVCLRRGESGVVERKRGV